MTAEADKPLADDLFFKAKAHWGQGEQWRQSNFDLMEMLIRDALQAYGLTNPERRVELQKMLRELESYRAPKDFAGIVSEVQRKIMHLVVKNRLLFFLACLTYAASLVEPIREPFVRSYAYLADFYDAHTRKDIILLRVGSPFDDEKPTLDKVNLSRLVRPGEAEITISTRSTTAKALLGTGEKLKNAGTTPEIVSFRNYGMYKPVGDVPYRGSTIVELFGEDNFVELIGPVAESIQSPGWVYINKAARNAQAAIGLGLHQRTCPDQAVGQKGVLARIHQTLLAEPGHLAHSICSLRSFGEITFALAEIILRTQERVGLARKYMIFQSKNGMVQPVSVTEDGVSGCYLDRKTGGDFCEDSLRNMPGALSISDGRLMPPAGSVPPPRVDVLSRVDMTNYWLENGQIKWADFEWRTTPSASAAFQIISFRNAAEERFIILEPAAVSRISSGFMFDGPDKSWRIITVAKSGQSTVTDWKPWKRIDCHTTGRCKNVS